MHGEEGISLGAFYIVVLVCSRWFSGRVFFHIAFRFGCALLLLFLCVGLIAGVDGLGIDFSNNGLSLMLGYVALAIILFDLRLRHADQGIQDRCRPAMLLASVGA